ncbi:excinuclease UvrABC nuclease subunit [Clavibacter michiganensis]|nr:excinuclease UvrABC nuclease subunit [Clavibacter michiganensis]
MTGEQVAVVNEWIKSCELAWTTTGTEVEAAALEHRLLNAWRPPINVA